MGTIAGLPPGTQFGVIYAQAYPEPIDTTTFDLQDITLSSIYPYLLLVSLLVILVYSVILLIGYRETEQLEAKHKKREDVKEPRGDRGRALFYTEKILLSIYVEDDVSKDDVVIRVVGSVLSCIFMVMIFFTTYFMIALLVQTDNTSWTTNFVRQTSTGPNKPTNRIDGFVWNVTLGQWDQACSAGAFTLAFGNGCIQYDGGTPCAASLSAAALPNGDCFLAFSLSALRRSSFTWTIQAVATATFRLDYVGIGVLSQPFTDASGATLFYASLPAAGSVFGGFFDIGIADTPHSFARVATSAPVDMRIPVQQVVRYTALASLYHEIYELAGFSFSSAPTPPAAQLTLHTQLAVSASDDLSIKGVLYYPLDIVFTWFSINGFTWGTLQVLMSCVRRVLAYRSGDEKEAIRTVMSKTDPYAYRLTAAEAGGAAEK